MDDLDGQSLDEKWAGIGGMPELLAELAAYEKALLDYVVTPDTGEGAEQARRLAVVVYLRSGLTTFDPVLMTSTLTAELRAAVTGASSELANYGWASQGGELPLANCTRQVAAPTSAETVASMVSALKYLHDLESYLKASIDAATAEVAAAQASRAAFEESTAKTIEDGETKIGEAVMTLTDSGGANIAEKLKDAEDDRAAASKAFAGAHEEAEQVLAEMREKLSIATDTALSHDYSKAAAAESTKADSMRNWSISFGVITGILAIIGVGVQVLIANSESYGSALALVPGKLAAVAAFGTISAWLGRESSRHREVARALRLTELQLRNLGSFLAELGPTDRNDARVRLLGRFFSDEPQPIEPDGPSHLRAVQQAMGGGE